MATKRKITLTRPMFGNKRSHSMRASRRKWQPNLQTKRIYVSELDRYVRVTVSVGELRTIDKIGLPAFLERQGRSINDLL